MRTLKFAVLTFAALFVMSSVADAQQRSKFAPRYQSSWTIKKQQQQQQRDTRQQAPSRSRLSTHRAPVQPKNDEAPEVLHGPDGVYIWTGSGYVGPSGFLSE